MAVAGSNLQSLARLQNKFTVLDFEGQFAFENVEELAGPNVGVPNLARTGRHEFLDDAELGCFDQVPAVAVNPLRASPLVMLSRFGADNFWHQSLKGRLTHRKLLQFAFFAMHLNEHGAEARSFSVRLDGHEVLIIVGADFHFPSVAAGIAATDFLIAIVAVMP